jgi:hypothetical protein
VSYKEELDEKLIDWKISLETPEKFPEFYLAVRPSNISVSNWSSIQNFFYSKCPLRNDSYSKPVNHYLPLLQIL